MFSVSYLAGSHARIAVLLYRVSHAFTQTFGNPLLNPPATLEKSRKTGALWFFFPLSPQLPSREGHPEGQGETLGEGKGGGHTALPQVAAGGPKRRGGLLK